MAFDPILEAKGKDGERFFGEWLDRCGRSYVHVNQSRETFAKLFKPNVVKRPDYFVLIDSIGLLAVDVKNRTMKNDGFTLPVDTELKPTLAFERIFRIPVWYAFRHAPEGSPEAWYWISALRAVEVGEEDADRNGVPFFHLHKDNFAVLESGADFGKLFDHVLPKIEKLAELPAANPSETF